MQCSHVNCSRCLNAGLRCIMTSKCHGNCTCCAIQHCGRTVGEQYRLPLCNGACISHYSSIALHRSGSAGYISSQKQKQQKKRFQRIVVHTRTRQPTRLFSELCYTLPAPQASATHCHDLLGGNTFKYAPGQFSYIFSCILPHLLLSPYGNICHFSTALMCRPINPNVNCVLSPKATHPSTFSSSQSTR